VKDHPPARKFYYISEGSFFNHNGKDMVPNKNRSIDLSTAKVISTRVYDHGFFSLEVQETESRTLVNISRTGDYLGTVVLASAINIIDLMRMLPVDHTRQLEEINAELRHMAVNLHSLERIAR
jgi:hypothetical protein